MVGINLQATYMGDSKSKDIINCIDSIIGYTKLWVTYPCDPWVEGSCKVCNSFEEIMKPLEHKPGLKCTKKRLDFSNALLVFCNASIVPRDCPLLIL